jgi:hypothetical protein
MRGSPNITAGKIRICNKTWMILEIMAAETRRMNPMLNLLVVSTYSQGFT